ncbi:hypothetical protein M2360_001030 [Rhizobium sp. SG_E_25_P2]|uniref:hypothetical protein n=1 Tax=Rhizobium sp. SG_E_25_P2 TaxID=2879942 RepID=UPI0024768CC5|nr:hypothetical protein [Rhizobium sp. SG_E_25_P2]MDH6265640.1 hypothetical protein [Rhizobium sp. SG_E_25_P2]
MTPATNASAIEFEDIHALPHVFSDLWRAVLLTAIEDAVHGPPHAGSHTQKLREIGAARAYILKPNPDFAEVCTLAGCDPEAVRDRVAVMISKAPSPDTLAAAQEKKKPIHTVRSSRQTGGGSRLASAIGTGGGRRARYKVEKEFSNMDTEAR